LSRELAWATGVVVAAAVVWLCVFFGTAYGVVWLIERFEGDASECWSSECGTFGEALDDHDLLGAVALAFVAAVPAAPLLWKIRRVMRGPFMSLSRPAGRA
jgi:hypothetical protein